MPSDRSSDASRGFTRCEEQGNPALQNLQPLTGAQLHDIVLKAHSSNSIHPQTHWLLVLVTHISSQIWSLWPLLGTGRALASWPMCTAHPQENVSILQLLNSPACRPDRGSSFSRFVQCLHTKRSAAGGNVVGFGLVTDMH